MSILGVKVIMFSCVVAEERTIVHNQAVPQMLYVHF